MYCRYVCPVCKEKLSEEEKSFLCINGHSFDKSAQGYVNLAAAKKQNTEDSGDAREACRARHAFLNTGLYFPLAKCVCGEIKKFAPLERTAFIIDAGCGEGYYSRCVKEEIPSADVYGADLAKYAVKTAAAFQKNNLPTGLHNHFSVGNIFDLPFEDGSADAVLSVFAPVADKEAKRVLKDGGILVVACPGKEHLLGLKKALYEKASENEEKIPDYDGFESADIVRIKYEMKIEKKTASDLFAMTPYYFKSSKEVKEKSENLGEITTFADFIVKVYKKK